MSWEIPLAFLVGIVIGALGGYALGKEYGEQTGWDNGFDDGIIEAEAAIYEGSNIKGEDRAASSQR